MSYDNSVVYLKDRMKDGSSYLQDVSMKDFVHTERNNEITHTQFNKFERKFRVDTIKKVEVINNDDTLENVIFDDSIEYINNMIEDDGSFIPGMNLDDFTNMKQVAKGGNGVVFQGNLRKCSDGMAFAIKVAEREMVENEIKVYTNFMEYGKEYYSQNVLKYYGWFKDANRACLIMEYINGGNFFDFVRRPESTLEQNIRYFNQLVDAVNWCHSIGTVHHDIKLQNVMIDIDKDRAVLIDFDMATINQPNDIELIGGTLHYIAPEILREELHGFEVDIWSLGVCLFIIYHPQHLAPFSGRDVRSTESNIKAMIWTHRLNNQTHQNIVKRFLHFDPSRRVLSRAPFP